MHILYHSTWHPWKAEDGPQQKMRPVRWNGADKRASCASRETLEFGFFCGLIFKDNSYEIFSDSFKGTR